MLLSILELLPSPVFSFLAAFTLEFGALQFCLVWVPFVILLGLVLGDYFPNILTDQLACVLLVLLAYVGVNGLISLA